MFGIEPGMRLYACAQPVDMRKGIATLQNMVLSLSPLDPMSGDVFVWFGKGRRSCKILRWYSDGFVLYHRKLGGGTFEVPWGGMGGEGFCELSWTTFSLIMEGISIGSAKSRNRNRTA